MHLIDTGQLARDTSKDHDVMWVLRMVEMVQILKEAKDVLSGKESASTLPEGKGTR